MRTNRTVRLWWRLLVGHLGTLLLSIIMGLIVWLIAINQENPLITQDYPEHLPIATRNLEGNLGATRDLSHETVQVVLQAPQSSWSTLQTSDLTAYVDLAGLGRGVHEVPVQVAVSDPQVTVKQRDPASLQIQLDTVITKTVPVTTTIMDNTAFGYDWQEPIVKPRTVTIYGPASQVESVTAAVAEVFLRGAKSQVERFETVDLVNEQNQPVIMVKALPPTVEVVVPVERWPDRKEVAVRVDLEGQPADGYRLGPLKVDPSIVVLRGNSAALSQIGFIETAPVSVANAIRDIRARPQLILPEGVTAFEGNVVDVIIGIVPVETSQRITLKPIIRGLGPGLLATVAIDTVDVIVSGPQSILSALESDDIFVILALDNLLPGSHAVRPDVRYPTGVRLEGVLPETVEVVISEQVEVEATSPLTTTQTPTMTATLAPTGTTTTATPSITTTRTATITATVAPTGTVTSP